MGDVLFWIFALAASGFMSTQVDEDGQKVAAFVVTLVAFALVFFVARDGGMGDCDFTGACY
jgi:uncharacterized membrane-anchored protein